MLLTNVAARLQPRYKKAPLKGRSYMENLLVNKYSSSRIIAIAPVRHLKYAEQKRTL